MRGTSVAMAAVLWLVFTRPAPLRADPARWTTGPTARVGSAVGFSQLGGQTVTVLGGEVAIGYRLGWVVVEAAYDGLHMLEYREDRSGNTYRGQLARYGVNGRLFFATLARPGGDSALRLYAELGAGRQHGRWSSGDTFARNDVATGAGWLLEHRVRPRPGGLGFTSVGWHFGWQLDTSRRDRVELATERTTCKTCGPPMPGADLDASLLVTCALVAAW
jgi:hypothetical protein